IKLSMSSISRATARSSTRRSRSGCETVCWRLCDALSTSGTKIALEKGEGESNAELRMDFSGNRDYRGHLWFRWNRSGVRWYCQVAFLHLPGDLHHHVATRQTKNLTFRRNCRNIYTGRCVGGRRPGGPDLHSQWVADDSIGDKSACLTFNTKL